MITRRQFLRTGCQACVGGGLLPMTLSGCASHHVTGTIEPTGISVLKSAFLVNKKNEPKFRTFLLVQQEKLEFPIYLYRLSDAEYSALWMECTHQGAELQASGDRLHCPSHGSEFTNRGMVSNGPAEKNLRTFSVSISNDKILIDLRA